jgi:hypothetical protein
MSLAAGTARSGCRPAQSKKNTATLNQGVLWSLLAATQRTPIYVLRLDVGDDVA